MGRFRRSGLPAVALCALLVAGCGENRTNEEVVRTTSSPTAAPTPAPTGEAPSYKNYADFARSQHKSAPEGKDAGKGQPTGRGKKSP